MGWVNKDQTSTLKVVATQGQIDQRGPSSLLVLRTPMDSEWIFELDWDALEEEMN